jgi:hypothetical protein
MGWKLCENNGESESTAAGIRIGSCLRMTVLPAGFDV